jgi:DNA (cytosine-5)-methyltransferase 1
MGNAAAGGFGITGSAPGESGFAAQSDSIGGMEHADWTGAGNGGLQRRRQLGRVAEDDRPGATNGFWRNAEWIACRDGKSRPTEPGVAPLVTGAPARVVRLRGYGNSINAEAAKEFVKAYMSAAA